jgi:hypothetical protein
LFVCLRTAAASSIADEIYRSSSGNLPVPLEQAQTVASAACMPNSAIARQLETEKIFNEYRQALNTAELDSRQRPIRFTIFGKIHTAIYEGETLTGYDVNGKTLRLSMDEQVSSPKTLFVHDENGVLKAALTFDPQSSVANRLKVPLELLLSASDAKSQIARSQSTNAALEPTSKYNELEVLPKVPCYICDFEASADLGWCGVLAGAILGADVTGVAIACGGTAGTACPWAVGAGVIGGAFAYNLYRSCAEKVQGRLRTCRADCS